MRRCNYCFRYAVGQPLYCPTCGRSYESRICGRGHVNPRNTHFCPTCGSGDFSTPAPPESFLGWILRWMLQLFVGAAVALLIIAAAVSVVARIDWNQLTPSLVSLLLMIGVLYWLTTLLPGPIKKV